MIKQVATLLLATIMLQACSQNSNKNSGNFRETFTLLYKSAGNFFTEVKGPPIISNMFGTPDTIGYRLKVLPDGVTDWKNISGSNSEKQTIFFKLGAYSTDSTAMAKRFNEVIAIIRQIDPAATINYDDSYSDSKIKEVYICPGSGPCGEDDHWRVSLYLHRFNGNEFNVSVNIQAFPPGAD